MDTLFRITVARTVLSICVCGLMAIVVSGCGGGNSVLGHIRTLTQHVADEHSISYKSIRCNDFSTGPYATSAATPPYDLPSYGLLVCSISYGPTVQAASGVSGPKNVIQCDFAYNKAHDKLAPFDPNHDCITWRGTTPFPSSWPTS